MRIILGNLRYGSEVVHRLRQFPSLCGIRIRMSGAYHEEAEAGINNQINLELYAMYTYLSMSSYFEREDVALPGFARYFRKASGEELEHAREFMKFQSDRGGRIAFGDIKKPAKDEWGSGLEAMEAALELEKTVNQALLDLHKIADKHSDFHMVDFIEGKFLTEQVESIKQLSGHITNLKRVGAGHGDYHFDKETL